MPAEFPELVQHAQERTTRQARRWGTWLAFAFLAAVVVACAPDYLKPGGSPGMLDGSHKVIAWIDLNQNGRREKGEPPLAGVHVALGSFRLGDPKGGYFRISTCVLPDAALDPQPNSQTAQSYPAICRDNADMDSGTDAHGVELVTYACTWCPYYGLRAIAPPGYRLLTEQAYTEKDDILEYGFAPAP